MYEFLEDKGLQKRREGGNWTYLLEEEDKFSRSGYKSVQMHLKNCMLKCAIVRFNGQLKFIYFTEGYKSLTDLLSTMQPNKLWHVLSKIMESFVKVKEFGFLCCENIDVSSQNIYVNPKTYEPYLIYVPLNTEENVNGQTDFIISVKRSLVMALKESSNPLMTEQQSQLLDIFDNCGHNLEDLMRALRAKTANVGGTVDVEHPEIGRNSVLVLTSAEPKIQYVMKQDAITIGRRKNHDVVLDFSTKISRDHCSISYVNGKYFVKDESTYGTCVNNTKCVKGKAYELKSGDCLRLPEIQFLVRIQPR